MESKVVYERHEDFDPSCGPYGGEKVGILIEDRVIWLAVYSGSKAEIENYQKWKGIAEKIAICLTQEGRETD